MTKSNRDDDSCIRRLIRRKNANLSINKKRKYLIMYSFCLRIPHINKSTHSQHWFVYYHSLNYRIEINTIFLSVLNCWINEHHLSSLFLISNISYQRNGLYISFNCICITVVVFSLISIWKSFVWMNLTICIAVFEQKTMNGFRSLTGKYDFGFSVQQ